MVILLKDMSKKTDYENFKVGGGVKRNDYIPRLKSGKDGSEQLFDHVAFSSAENYDVLCAVA